MGPTREGGREVVAEELAVRMVRAVHSVTCYNRKNPQTYNQKILNREDSYYKGIQLKTVYTFKHRGFAAMTSSICATIHAAFQRYDIIHFHTEGTCIMLWLPHILGKKTIVTIHGLDHMRAKWGRLASFYIAGGSSDTGLFMTELKNSRK